MYGSSSDRNVGTDGPTAIGTILSLVDIHSGADRETPVGK